MRIRFAVPPLAMLSSLALAAPAMAADHTVAVTDDFTFAPEAVEIALGDSVTWRFDSAGHTSTSDKGQPESWDSAPDGTNAQGTTFSRTFTKPGRYQYLCKPHASFMKGTVTVGEDEFAKSQSKFKQVRKGKTIRFDFTLAEPAKVVAKLRGPSRKSATRKRLATGKHSIAFKRLKKGQYKGTVTFTDDFDKKSVVKTFTVIR